MTNLRKPNISAQEIQIKAKKLIETKEWIEEMALTIPDDLLSDILSIKTILSDIDICTHYLKEIEDDFFAMLKKNGVVSDDGKIILKKGKEYTPQYKVISQYIDKWASNSGFNQGHPMHVTVGAERKIFKPFSNRSMFVITMLTNNAFRTYLLRQGYTFKDASVTPALHGEITHMLQLLILDKANRDFNIFHNKLSFLYQYLGTSNCVDEYYSSASVELKSLWDYVFDTLYDKDALNFSIPEELNLYLIGKDKASTREDYNAENLKKKVFMDEGKIKHFPILSQLLEGRYEKRTLGFGGSSADSYYKNKFNTNPGVKPPLLVSDFYGLGYYNEKENKYTFAKHSELIGEYFYDVKIAEWFPTPKIDMTTSIQDQLKQLFNLEVHQANCHDDDLTEVKKIFDECVETNINPSKFSSSLLPVYFPEEILSKLKKYVMNNKGQMSDYVFFVVNEAIRIIIHHDLAELKEYGYVPDARLYSGNNCFKLANYQERNSKHKLLTDDKTRVSTHPMTVFKQAQHKTQPDTNVNPKEEIDLNPPKK